MFNPFSKKEDGVAIPLDYLPERRATTNPFTKKEVENVLHQVMSGYQNMGLSRQHDISMLVLQLQELVTSDEHSSKLMVTNQNDAFCVRAPTNSTLKKEPQKRLKSKLKKVNEAISSKKMKSIQRMGIR